MADFKIVRGERGPEYHGPHGPIEIVWAATERTEIIPPGGERATLDWTMARRDLETLVQGVAARIAGEDFTLSLQGRTLVVQDAGGQLLATVRRGWFGRGIVTDPAGERVALIKPGLSGRVAEDVSAAQVQLVVLVLTAGLVLIALDRGPTPGPLLPGT